MHQTLGDTLGEGSETLGSLRERLPPVLWGDLIPRDKPGSQRCFLKLPSLYVCGFFLLKETRGREIEDKSLNQTDLGLNPSSATCRV